MCVGYDANGKRGFEWQEMMQMVIAMIGECLLLVKGQQIGHGLVPRRGQAMPSGQWPPKWIAHTKGYVLQSVLSSTRYNYKSNLILENCWQGLVPHPRRGQAMPNGQPYECPSHAVEYFSHLVDKQTAFIVILVELEKYRILKYRLYAQVICGKQ